MKQVTRKLVGATLVGAAFSSVLNIVNHSHAAVVINEAYGGGGNGGSTFKNDFVELYNNSATATADISGFEVAYGSAAAAFTPGPTETAFLTIIPANTTIAPLSFFLIQEAPGAGGTTSLPNVNLTDATPIAMSSSTFKLELLDTTSSTPAPSDVVDLLGVGPTVSAYEGVGPAPVLSNTISAQRLVDGVDTNNNNIDFGTGTPTPGTTNVAVAVPEPASLGLVAIGGLLATRRRRPSN